MMSLGIFRGTCWGVIAATSVFLTFSTAKATEAKPISFTLRTWDDANSEGPNVKRTFFTVGKKRIAVGLPKGCRFNATEDKLALVLLDADVDGEIYVTASPFSPDVDLATNALKYRDAAQADLPRGASGVATFPPQMNVYSYNGWKSLGFTWTYVLIGRSSIRTITYLNLDVGAQVVVTTLAAGKDTEKVAKIAQQFVSSWWVMAQDQPE